MTDVHPNDLSDYAHQLSELAKDIHEAIEQDEIVQASTMTREASILLSRLAVGFVDLTIQRRKG